MKIVGFEYGKVTVQLDAAECSAVAEACLRPGGRSPLADPIQGQLGDAFAVCARIATAQGKQALIVRFPRPPLAFARQERSIVSVD